MDSGLNNLHILFVVNERNMLESLSERIKRMGFTVKDASSAEDISKYTSLKSVPLKKFSTAETNDDIPPDLIYMLQSISSETASIVIALEDLSLLRICRNTQRLSPDNHPTLGEVEREHIIATLRRCSWKRKTAAKLLGIDRSTLYRKMKKYGISDKK